MGKDIFSEVRDLFTFVRKFPAVDLAEVQRSVPYQLGYLEGDVHREYSLGYPAEASLVTVLVCVELPNSNILFGRNAIHVYS